MLVTVTLVPGVYGPSGENSILSMITSPPKPCAKISSFETGRGNSAMHESHVPQYPHETLCWRFPRAVGDAEVAASNEKTKTVRRAIKLKAIDDFGE